MKSVIKSQSGQLGYNNWHESTPKTSSHRIIVGITSAVIVLVLLTAGQFIATAQPAALRNNGAGIGSIFAWQADCSSFGFQGTDADKSGYAAVRIWLNSSSGTPIVDSYVAGYPSYYTPIDTNPNLPGDFSGKVTFPAQQDGTTLVVRVYHALVATPGSYDGGAYIDTTVHCSYGIYGAFGTLYCNNFVFSAGAFPSSGFAGVRISVGSMSGTKLVDSYTSGYPSYFAPISGGGVNGAVSYPSQPIGTTLVARIYRTSSPIPQSWDGQHYVDITQPCAGQPATPTPQ